MAQKITHVLLIALILSLGFGQLLRFEFLGLPLYLHDILVVLIISLLFLQGQTLKVEKQHLQGLTLMGAGIVISWLYALTLYPLSSLLIPFLYTLRLLSYLAFYLLIKQSKFLISNSYFLITSSITLLIGLSQYFLMPDMRWAQYLGWDDHLSRLTLPHFDPTFTAVMLGLFLFSQPLQPLLQLPQLTAILLTYSRSVWLSLTLTLFFFIKNKTLFLITLCLFLITIFYALPRSFGEGTNLLRTYSISSRLQSDYSYIAKYNWQLLIGRGMNTLILDQSSTQYDNHASGPNNSYLYLLATTGILGLVGWGKLMFSLYSKSAHKPMLIFFFVSSLFNNVLFYPFALLWVLIIESMVPTSA